MFAPSLRLTIPVVIAVLLLVPAAARAHCDSLDGPVVKAAQRALDTGDVNRAFVWIAAADEAEVRAAFDKALTVRALGGTASELADLYFFETVVRLHRRSEGEPYTGLKPAGRDLGPLIPAADQAILTMSAEPLVNLLTREVARGVHQRFDAVMAARVFPGATVAASRGYIAAYVDFIEYLEQLQEALFLSDEDAFLTDHMTPDDGRRF